MILSYDEKNMENSEQMDVRNMLGNTGKETKRNLYVNMAKYLYHQQ